MLKKLIFYQSKLYSWYIIIIIIMSTNTIMIPTYETAHHVSDDKISICNNLIIALDLNSMCNHRSNMISSVIKTLMTFLKNYNFGAWNETIDLILFSETIIHNKFKNIVNNRDVYDRIICQLGEQKYIDNNKSNFVNLFKYIFNNFDPKTICDIVLVTNGTPNLIEEERLTNFFNHNWSLAYNLIIIGVGWNCEQNKNIVLEMVHNEASDENSGKSLEKIRAWHMCIYCEECDKVRCDKNNHYCRYCDFVIEDGALGNVLYDCLLKNDKIVCDNCGVSVGDAICNINFLTKIMSCAGAIISMYCSDSADIEAYVQKFIDKKKELTYAIPNYIVEIGDMDYEFGTNLCFALAAGYNSLIQMPFGYYLFTSRWALLIKKENHFPEFLHLKSFTSTRKTILKDDPNRNYEIKNEINQYTPKKYFQKIPTKNLTINFGDYELKPAITNTNIRIHNIVVPE